MLCLYFNAPIAGRKGNVIKGIGVVTCIYVNPELDDSRGKSAYQQMESLSWTAEELQEGKILKIKGFPKEHKVHCFQVVVSTNRTYFIVTNEPQNSTEAIQDAYSFRWWIEQLHGESKQLTGLENCQCRKSRIQRNHIGCALLVWVRLKDIARITRQTIYQVKHGLLDDYLCHQLKNPSLNIVLA